MEDGKKHISDGRCDGEEMGIRVRLIIETSRRNTGMRKDFNVKEVH